MKQTNEDLTKVIKNFKSGFILIADKKKNKVYRKISGISAGELLNIVADIVVDIIKADSPKAESELRKDVEEALMKRLAGEQKEKIDMGYIG